MPPLLQTGIGVVAPNDFALDRELWRWTPDDVSLHLTRMPYVPLAATVEMAMHIAEPVLVARSAINVLAVSPLVTAYACTSGSYDVITVLEADLGKPVLTANQITMWAAIRLAGRAAVGAGQRLMASV
jgi:maleate cis-trans isomerase